MGKCLFRIRHLIRFPSIEVGEYLLFDVLSKKALSKVCLLGAHSERKWLPTSRFPEVTLPNVGNSVRCLFSVM